MAWSSQIIAIGLQGTGLAPPRTAAGPIALDLNLEIGDQGVRKADIYGRSVTVDLAVTEGALGTNGLNVVVGFDTTAVSFSEFVLTDLYQIATPIVTGAADSAEFSVVFFGDGTAQRASGSAGRLRFTFLNESLSAEIRIVRASFALPSGPVPLNIGSEGARITVKRSLGPAADFDGDGSVGFTDFILFAGKFGTSAGNAGFNPIFDLDGNGSVGFTDFILFGGQFGTGSGKPVLTKPTQH